MQRILIIGCSGAGKSTLSNKLGQILHIKVIHLDALFWNKGWVPTPKAEWREKVENLCKRKQWILDGNFGSTLQMRFQYADTVIFFDYTRLECLYHIIKRRFMYAGKSRPDMAKGCPEKIDAEFIKFIWNFNKTKKPQILKLLRECKGQLFVLKSNKDVKKLISNMNSTGKAQINI